MNNRYFQSLKTILSSIDNIDKYIGNPRVFEQYDENLFLQQAVERNLEIIGEATKRILEIKSDIKITNARSIISARNKIIHGYDEIENIQIWNIIINHLPLLRKEANDLLNA